MRSRSVATLIILRAPPSVAMLPFADAAFKPGIETLILVGCPGALCWEAIVQGSSRKITAHVPAASFFSGIGDTGLSWICDGVFESLVLLNIKGGGRARSSQVLSYPQHNPSTHLFAVVAPSTRRRN